MAEIIEEVMCPIVGNLIDIGLCSDIQDVVDDLIFESVIEQDINFSLTDKHKEACHNCKKRKDPSL